MTKDEWIGEFATVLMLELRPEIGNKFARTLATTEWVQHGQLAPRDAAHRWAARRPAPKAGLRPTK